MVAHFFIQFHDCNFSFYSIIGPQIVHKTQPSTISAVCVKFRIAFNKTGWQWAKKKIKWDQTNEIWYGGKGALEDVNLAKQWILLNKYTFSAKSSVSQNVAAFFTWLKTDISIKHKFTRKQHHITLINETKHIKTNRKRKISLSEFNTCCYKPLVLCVHNMVSAKKTYAACISEMKGHEKWPLRIYASM